MIPILVAHGTRAPEGTVMIGELAERVGGLLAQPVRVAFVDVLGPNPAEILAAEADSGRPAILVPAFLARGYHVGVDVPTQVAASGHPDVTITPALGPDPRVAAVVAARLAESGWRPGDSVILAAAGSSDPVAHTDLMQAAEMLSGLLGSRVNVAFAATGGPSVPEAVAALRSQGAARVVIASYLLADGLFQRRLRTTGADLVTEPLGTHPEIARVVADRFITALSRIPVR
ncbi:sirohydrochlorin chelatase [Mycolicibacter heraklionensis]|uniref:Sirohydrochlorin chelatase n=1 Tax=Mycolicibacter heraklionensis TaxID=512402 RepID=A0A9X7ZGZ3_9MYCO|nr:sirohydrochlorin chelatase [Mycolicibacter heraklionensis]QZA08032.1 sirohydrochlorin chelatase [Mycolicibacter heraklionensis]